VCRADPQQEDRIKQKALTWLLGLAASLAWGVLELAQPCVLPLHETTSFHSHVIKIAATLAHNAFQERVACSLLYLRLQMQACVARQLLGRKQHTLGVPAG